MEWADVPLWAWVVFYLIGSLTAGPLLVKFGRSSKKGTREEGTDGEWLLFGLVGSWLSLAFVILAVLIVWLLYLVQDLTEWLNGVAKHIP